MADDVNADTSRFADGDPAAIDWVDERVRVSHARFLAELDPITAAPWRSYLTHHLWACLGAVNPLTSKGSS